MGNITRVICGLRVLDAAMKGSANLRAGRGVLYVKSDYEGLSDEDLATLEECKWYLDKDSECWLTVV